MEAIADPEPRSTEFSTDDSVEAREIVGGRYRLGAMLGRGGMGEVYRAFDAAQGRQLAIKRFRLATDREEDKLRFRREFHTLARLRHPRVVEAYDFGVEESGQPYYTMELLDGHDLGDVSPLPWANACPLLRDVASALAFLHARQLLHRDIAPRNVRCTSDGRAKLIDFGMLSTMGVSNEIVGTLPSIAPEMILGLPMDARADLYGLGALAFWLLTGKHPQRVRSLEDLVRNGRRPPPPPSRVVEGIPEELDDLVLSLLSPEPLGRPSSAGEVIDRLTAIAELERAPELDSGRGYVQSVALVGREREMDLVRRRIERMASGLGSSILVEGRSGMGKTRLMREIELEAKLAGALVLRGEGELSGPYAMIRTLARELELGVRGGMIGNSGPHGALIDRLLPVLGRRDPRSRGGMTMSSTDTQRVDHREERLALQTALSDFLSTFAMHRPLVLLIDNIHRVDEGSAAVLASLSHVAKERRLLLVGAIRTDEEARASQALANIRERALIVRARGLDVEEVQALIESMFGETQGALKLAQWIHGVSAGSPMLCTELLRHLVEKGHIRDLGGAWKLPEDIPEDVPQRLEQALDERIGGLEANTRALGQALAVLGHEAPLSFCVALSPRMKETEVFAAIDQLVHEEVVIGSGERYRLRHDGLREALLRTLDPDARRNMELAVGEMLASLRPVSPEREARIGWHLLRGGEKKRGAELLHAAGERLFEATSFEDCVAPLEAALEVYEAEGRSRGAVSEIHYMLIAAGFYSDREVAVRHRERAIEVVGQQCGIERARRWRRFLGGTLAFVVSLFVTGVLHRLRSARRRGPGPIESLEHFIRVVVYSAGVAGFSFDTKTLYRCADALEPLRPVRRVFVANALGFADNLLNFNLGRLNSLMTQSEANLAQLEAMDARITEEERALSVGGARFQRGMVGARAGDESALEEIEKLESLGPRIWAIGALQLRTYYHMWRGEIAEARRVWSQAELEFVRLGALWQLHAIHHSSACMTHAVLGDVLGLKRSIEGLAQQVDAGLRFEGYLAIARGEYERLAGQFDEALASLDEAMKWLPEGEGLPRPWALTARAATLLDAGRLAEAIEAGEAALAHATDPEYGQPAFAARAARIIALAKAGLGETDDALQELAALVARLEEGGNPYFAGTMHEARARVAYDAGLLDEAAAHCDAAGKFLLPTRNPVLVARHERLMRYCGLGGQTEDLMSASGDEATEVFGTDTMAESVAHVMSILSECHDADTRAERALRALLDDAGAESGFLYLMRRGRLCLAAPTSGAEPPSEVPHALQDALATVRPDSEEIPTIVHRRDRGWRMVLLSAQPDDESQVVGALVVNEAERTAKMPHPALRDAIGQRLWDEGDVLPVTAEL